MDQSDKRTARSRLEADTVLAHAYPTKPVRLIEPFGAGGGPDLIARALAQKLSGVLVPRPEYDLFAVAEE